MATISVQTVSPRRHLSSCSKVGHIAPVCRSKPKPEKERTHHAKWVIPTDPPDSSDNVEPLLVVRNSSSRPYKVELWVNGQPVTMEVDTGAGVSIAPESLMETLQPPVELQKTNIVLKT